MWLGSRWHLAATQWAQQFDISARVVRARPRSGPRVVTWGRHIHTRHHPASTPSTATESLVRKLLAYRHLKVAAQSRTQPPARPQSRFFCAESCGKQARTAAERCRVLFATFSVGCLLVAFEVICEKPPPHSGRRNWLQKDVFKRLPASHNFSCLQLVVPIMQ